MPKFTADPFCCLHTPTSVGGQPVQCAIIRSKREIMGKADSLRENEFSCAGRSITEILEDELDVEMDWLMEKSPDVADDLETALHKGRAAGIARALAVFLNPYLPNENAVKADAVVRYENRQKEEESDDQIEQASSVN